MAIFSRFDLMIGYMALVAAYEEQNRFGGFSTINVTNFVGLLLEPKVGAGIDFFINEWFGLSFAWSRSFINGFYTGFFWRR